MSSSPYLAWLGTWLLLIAILLPKTASGEFIPASNNSCACPNRVLTYTCTVVGGGSTIWTGSALSTCSDSELFLLHSEFADGTAVETCNNGAIIGQGLKVDGNRYTSELRINVSDSLNNLTIHCLNAQQVTVGEASINVISDSGAFDTQLQQPTVVSSMAGVQLNFTWTVVNLDCNSVDSYQITASGCGDCPVATETTSALCSALQMPAVCRFSVQSMVCGEVGMPSNEVTVSVRVPEEPQVTITPVYTAAMQLERLNLAIINRQNSVDNSGSVLEAVTNYSIAYYGDSMTSVFARNTSCVTDSCMYIIDVPSEVCSSLDHADVTLSASNVFGVGPSSNITVVGCTNQFVRVEYNRDSSVITCTFLNESDTSIKSCTVIYVCCNQEQVNTVQGISTEATPNRITLQVNGNAFEYYTVIASSARSSVIVEGTNIGIGSNRLNIVAAVVVPIVILIIIIILTILVLSSIKVLYKKDTGTNKQQNPINNSEDVDENKHDVFKPIEEEHKDITAHRGGIAATYTKKKKK